MHAALDPAIDRQNYFPKNATKDGVNGLQKVIAQSIGEERTETVDI